MEYIPENKVIDILRIEYDNWIKSLTENEIHAIKKYTYNSMDESPMQFFRRLNARLREEYNKNDSKMLEKYANIISNAIKKHSLEHNIICYRGSDFNYIDGIKKGTIFTLNQFTSTSVIKSKMFAKKYKFIIYAPKGTKGAYIEKLSSFPKQREFLLDKDCKYKLLYTYKNSVYLEVVV